MAEMSFLESPLTSQLKLADDTHGKDGLLQLAYIALSGKCSWDRSVLKLLSQARLLLQTVDTAYLLSLTQKTFRTDCLTTVGVLYPFDILAPRTSSPC